MKNRPSTITVDGPAAAGKSTIGKLLAHQLGYSYLDVGLLYRGLTALAFESGVDIKDNEALASLAENMDVQIMPLASDSQQASLLINGRDLSFEMYMPKVESHVASIAHYPSVWEALRNRARELGRGGDIVVVGRDIGSVVLPDADLKLFLDAPLSIRTQRRLQDMAAKGIKASYDAVAEDISQRDLADGVYDYLAADAIMLTTDSKTPREVLEQILEWFAETQEENSGQDLQRSNYEPV